ncbi:hypothetical protein BgiBS90_035719 [Biomphalaria glabrata]|nr:hypothetical protein BgiBS90_035719 [Biomphalaria glabrata]
MNLNSISSDTEENSYFKTASHFLILYLYGCNTLLMKQDKLIEISFTNVSVDFKLSPSIYERCALESCVQSSPRNLTGSCTCHRCMETNILGSFVTNPFDVFFFHVLLAWLIREEDGINIVLLQHAC